MNKNIEEISFEDRINRAKEILEKLSKQDIPLSEGLQLYKDGVNELKLAQENLEKAKLEFESIKNDTRDAS